ncbi:protein ENHANCED DISEASE RESISTANCE 2-like isoform X2 [Ricinus communis]|uniref:protein ENHANCED DISEASE RESISTANCE 2-like isoform X2 n=1 Tax=Ricinus communis TaxID=3988 RepID=UPI00201AF9FB|nr:protein ENHANCED DISEASE RESISTANCE 2-like isoform X2 [Ricinus communis]
MDMPQNIGRMEGWLYTIRSNRFGLQFSRKRYFILEENCLKCYKTIPISEAEEPVRSATVDSCIRVTDNGRESINRKVFFIFTLYSTLNHNDQLKLGARSSEEAAEWIRSLQNALTKECPHPAKDFVAISKRKWPPIRLSVTKRVDCKRLIDYYSTLHTEAMTSDVIAPSPWKIFGCQNGLRLFKEAKDWDSSGGHWDDHPAVMAVGVVDGTSEAIFQTLMSLGPLRSEWDYCFYRGSMVEHLDGHTDIIHKQLYNDWFPRGLKRRDLLLRRYWRRDDDGTYVILYQSVIHKKCPPQKGYVRACLKSGGYVITPLNQGTRSLVKHMLAVDWKSWKLYMRPSSERSITIRMIERVAALRELFRAKAGNYSDFRSGEISRQIMLPQIEKVDMNVEDETLEKIEQDHNSIEEGTGKLSRSLTGLNNASDEFFDVPNANEMMDCDSDNEWPSESTVPLRLSSAAGLVKKLHDLAVHKKNYVDLQGLTGKDSTVCFYGATLQKDPSCTLPCSWAAADPSTFLIRGENYLRDHKKVKSKGTLMQMVGADWLRSSHREDDLGSRPDSIVQKYATQGRPEFFFIVNIQIPGSSMHTLAMYYMLKTPLEDTPLLQKFVNGDDAFRNSRFKLIPYISKGSWIVKQSVGKKACLVGQALEVNYFRGKTYLELQIDAGSSTIARGVVSLVLGYLNNLVMEMAFLIQGETEEELPEILLGTCRLNHLDASKSVLV